jgi:TetR/AcrR family transcriptional regulator, transcriptional repressor of aconitase
VQMPRGSDADRDQRREQILDAARHCFARRGLAETSVRDIYEEAGLSEGAVYVYFGTKDDIVEVLADEVFTRVRQWVESLEGAEDALPALERVVRSLVAVASAEPRDELGLRVQAWGAAVTQPRVAAMLSEGLAYARAAISTAAARAASGTGVDEEAAARAVLAVLQGYLLQVLFDPPDEPERYADACVLMLRSALGHGAEV